MVSVLGRAHGINITRYDHAFIVLDDYTAMEPWPSGARLTQLEDFDENPVAHVWMPALDDAARQRVTHAARALDGATYRARDFHVITSWRRGRRGRRVCRAISDARRLPPGRFVAEAYRQAGVPLFGGRPDVTVGDLAALTVTVNGWDQRVYYP